VPGLVEQLQAEALNPEHSVSTLLRKVKVTAVKLKLDQTVDWADKELLGYNGQVPAYRVIRGRCKGFNSYHGWTLIGGDAETVDALSRRAVGQPISSLEELVSGESDHLIIPLPRKTANKIIEANFGCEDVALHVSRSDLVALIDNVRNLVLDWALDLERAGITGEGISFSEAEKKIADTSHIEINLHGPNARLNIGSADSSSNIAIDDTSSPGGK
jgi:hypothetical protein